MDEDLTSATLRAIRRILRATDQGSHRLYAATGLTTSQFLVLQEIDRRGDATPGTIATALQFGQATITNIADRLVAAGLITRRRGERDKRQVILAATDAGRAALGRAPDLLQERFRDRFQGLPLWERAMILAALERVGSLLDASGIDAAPLIAAGAIDRAAGPPAEAEPAPRQDAAPAIGHPS
ncbi:MULTISPECIES: MarR family winged helix-turn-helix transcriptional regulator [Acidiphilium]|jgi:DNA-binding MarR family transcriptional regulator|uniref:Transcriptional regulator, MarR family n=2 Tax=Acidiphilium TaxID=522 RepID=A5G2W5_ACICJ|nr:MULTISPECIES: MarR family transcriptional regulator [Acidiphilium]MBU6355145.1 MarR family transcriptional regulator [Rhodospirillales bacterium]ABQ32197.1 transcriptional regulator, MarR family [Acidiphilium cryptum JF-5]EGO94318.1 MarR family transcriptional regulator [Acidiphilium sp. PM]KDM68452.1 MarR family transcriptional regulator [Acidiphilium sp. JA12-A1]MDE2327596.1 MarR family transcriptional regulator [Rhodospirillales bacterium]